MVVSDSTLDLSDCTLDDLDRTPPSFSEQSEYRRKSGWYADQPESQKVQIQLLGASAKRRCWFDRTRVIEFQND